MDVLFKKMYNNNASTWGENVVLLKMLSSLKYLTIRAIYQTLTRIHYYGGKAMITHSLIYTHIHTHSAEMAQRWLTLPVHQYQVNDSPQQRQAKLFII